jgi:hypothetical protein
MTRKARPDTGQRPWFRYVPNAAYEESLRKSRRFNESEVKSVASALFEHNVLAGIPADRYRTEKAGPRLIEVRMAEQVSERFSELRLYRRTEETPVRVAIKREAHAKCAKIMRAVGSKGWAEKHAKEAEWLAHHERQIRSEKSFELYRATKTNMAKSLTELTFDLVAILMHTTDLTENFILDKEVAPGIVPQIFSVAWKLYPDCRPARGAANPMKRYKDAVKRVAVKERHLFERRVFLFAGDERFPGSLFERHKSTRTVERRMGRRTTLH